MRFRVVTAVLVGLLVLPDLAGAISVAEEKKLGRRFALEAAGQLPIIEDAAVVDLVRGMGRRLVAGLGAQPFDYRFQVVAHPALNAFAVPGGYVYVFSGLIARVSSVDELASVVGHEIAHVHAHHALRQQEQSQLWNYASLLGVLLAAVQPVLGVGAMAAAATAQLQYSREFEEEADYLGLRFMQAGGYDASAMPAFFKKILAEQRLNPASVPPYLLTHPLTEDRIAKVETSISTSPRGSAALPAKGERELEEVRAVVLSETGAPEVVLADYERRAKAAPEDGFAQYLLGIVYAGVGRLDAARGAFEEANRLQSHSERLPVRLAQVYLRVGRLQEAKSRLEGYLESHGDDAHAHGWLGHALFELGDQRAAMAELERSIALDPIASENHRLLGQLYGRVDRSGEAFYHLAKAFELRGKLKEALSHYVRSRDALDVDDPRLEAVRASIKELKEIVAQERRDTRR